MDWKKGLLILGGLGAAALLIKKITDTPATSTSNPSQSLTSTGNLENMPTVTVDTKNPTAKVDQRTGKITYGNEVIPPIYNQPIGSTGGYASYKINGQDVTQAYYNQYKADHGLV